MNIPPKYEDVVAKVSELERRESDLMEKIARAGRVSFSFFEERDAALASEAALREELSGSNRRLGACINQIEEQQQRLTVAEQLLSRALQYGGMTPDWRDSVEEALKTDADCERGYSNQTGCPVCQGIKP